MSGALAGAWGARVGPPFVRRLQDGERPLVLAALLSTLVLALAFFLGVGVLVLVLDPGAEWVRTLVAGCFLLPAAGALTMTAETATRWWWRHRRPGAAVLAPAPSGVPSTAVLRSRAAFVTPWALGLSSTAWCVVMAAATDSPPWLRALFGLLGVAAASRLLALVLGRAEAGGVYLTPDALELRWGVVTTTVPWDELARWRPHGLAGGLERPPGTTEHRSFPVQVAGDVTDGVPRGMVPVPAAYLALPAPRLWALVDLGLSAPHVRSSFGTPRSLEWHVEPPSSPPS